MSSLTFSHTVTERFLRYVTIDTQSDPESPSSPSTEKQKDLGRVLAAELRQMGVEDAHLDDYGYVYGTIPANTTKKVPVICFCSHMDTSPDVTGKNVKPQVVKNYRGGDITLPGDTSQVIRFAEHPALKNQIGNDIITTDGTTLLGADNKAGVAEIMDAAHFFINNPDVKHGTIKILFTPDEEIGRGVDNVDIKKLGADNKAGVAEIVDAAHFFINNPDVKHGTIKILFTPDEEIGRGVDNVDIKKLGAEFGYTMDGESAGSVEDETFSADGATITINGVSAHPGYAKGKMEHAIKIAAAIVERLPREGCSPETTSGKQGFLHPIGIEGALEQATLSFIVRDFTEEGLKEKEILLENIVKDVMKDFPRSTYTFEVREQYRNMKQVIDRHPHILEYAIEAIRRAGLRPMRTAIRGGTDGSRLSFMGLPCPNIFAGEHAFHSRLEWVSRQDMEKAVQTIVHLAMIWEEKA
jgi:tripeptide aminopeptidase